MKTTALCIVIALAGAPLVAGSQELHADGPTPEAAVMTPAKPDPEVAKARVSTALKTTQGVPARDLFVSIHAGTLVVSGEVNTEAEMVAANAAAEKAAEGVRVSSNITVRPLEERPLKDQQAAQRSEQLVRDVEAALQADSRTANLGVAVTTPDARVVVLQGLVPTAENRTAVQNVVARVKGVARVDNRLQVPR